MQVSQLGIEWNEFKRAVRELWDLNETELAASEQSITRLENIIVNKYSHESPEIIHQMMEKLINSFNNPSDHSPNRLYQTSFERRPSH